MRINHCFKLAICAAVLVSSLSGCNKQNLGDGLEPDYYEVSLGMTGDILEVTEEPLTRADARTDLYGIQVYSAPNKELSAGESDVWTKYAYGLFGSDKNITIKLIKGNKYKFVATMVVDGQNKVKSYSSGYAQPFWVSGTNSHFAVIGDDFEYQSADYMGLASGYTVLAHDGENYYHPNTERFYGELVDFIPGMHGSKALIKMKRVSFGAKFHAKGKLAKEGTLEAQITEAPKMLLDLSVNEKIMSDIFTFKNLDKAYADNNYSETIAVTLNWHKPDGTVFPLGTHDIAFKRNKMSVINVTIDTDQANGEIGIEIDDDEMTEDENQTDINNGELEDTDVETNA